MAHQKNGTQGTAYGTNNRRTTLWGETEPWSNVCSTRTTAWHANAESLTTIGIEHNARDPGDATLSGIQYWKSAELVVWLGRQMAIPMDRWYILGHSEIDPGTSHSRCPNGHSTGTLKCWPLRRSRRLRKAARRCSRCDSGPLMTDHCTTHARPFGARRYWPRQLNVRSSPGS